MCQDERPVMRQRALHFLRRSQRGDRERVEILPRLGAIRLAEIPRKRNARRRETRSRHDRPHLG
jgi:hypothetical protein